MQIYAITIFVFSSLSTVMCQILPECQAWSEIEDRIKQESNHLSCVKNSNCTAMNCSGSIRGEEFSAGLQIHHCEKPSFITALFDAPQLNIHNWQRSFTHGSTFDLSGNIKGEISLLKEKDRFIIGLSVKISTDLQKYVPGFSGAPLKFPIFNGTTFPVPSCGDAMLETTTLFVKEQTPVTEQTKKILDPELQSYRKVIGNCSINNSHCRREETCLQLSKSLPDGICVCRLSYTRNETGYCVYTPESSTTDSSAIPIPESQAADENGTSTPVLRTALLVSVTAILLLIGIAYVVYRFRVFQYLRRKFRAQVYEHVLLGQQDDNDEPLADPVA